MPLFSIRNLFQFVLLSTFNLRSFADVLSQDGRKCDCGFYDANTQNLFTESIIIYFNETSSLPLDGWETEDYVNLREKSWNSIYRQGATPANAAINDSSLALAVSPSDPDHLVMGAGIKTIRKDIQYGSFRSFLRSPGKKTHGGSALSMILQYNDTQSLELAVMNTDDTATAWVGTFFNGEFPTRDIGTNYSVLGNNSAQIGIDSPWDFTEYRVDWTEKGINYSVGTNITREVLKSNNSDLFSVPAPLEFKHWSIGNEYSMQGPPGKYSVANIGWIRIFFNTSTMSTENHQQFDARCSVQNTCSVDDFSLRGSSPHEEAATVAWKQADPREARRIPAIIIAVLCITTTTILLIHAIILRAPWRRWTRKADVNEKEPKVQQISANPSKDPNNTLVDSSKSSAYSSPNFSRPTTRGEDDLAITPVQLPTTAPPNYSQISLPHRTSSTHGYWDSHTNSPGTTRLNTPWDSQTTTPRHGSPRSASPAPLIRNPFHDSNAEKDSKAGDVEMVKMSSTKESSVSNPLKNGDDKGPSVSLQSVPAKAEDLKARPPLQPQRRRVDYLAGVVALCAILVTIMHFGLTYVPALVMPGSPYHFKSEIWAQKIIAPFILNQMWLGVFFTTSVRFLTDKYLKTGDLKHVAQATVRRTPRLMIPIATIALLEYFLIDCGATRYLEYVPSLSWSTWAYVERYPTFGHFISEILELIYLVPNAVPQITFNYCTGVLWTTAVQLQFSWVCLIGVIIVRQIKTTWKRVTFYIFTILVNWYAQSWGTYFWFGILLTDLDVNYKYRAWLQKRPLAYYPYVTFCWCMVGLGFAANIAPNWSNYQFAVYEHDIHPDIPTGLPLVQTENAGYPPYYVPRLNGFLFAAGMQAIVEISPTVQWLLSRKALVIVFPHIFTIYLIHGMIFWSWGSWLMCFIADRGINYHINVAVVGISSYMILILSLPILTPIIEALGKDITNQIWIAANSPPAPKRYTLFPFPEDLFLKRDGNDEDTSCGKGSLYDGKDANKSRFSL
jgi:hypothetical protein